MAMKLITAIIRPYKLDDLEMAVAQLGVQGLATGLLFVELDFLDPKNYPADNRTTELKYVSVPAVPSAISAFQSSASEILANLKKVRRPRSQFVTDVS